MSDTVVQSEDRYPWVEGFDSVFDQVFFNETTERKHALTNVGIFACARCQKEDSLAFAGLPASITCSWSNDAITSEQLGTTYSSFLQVDKYVIPFTKGAHAAATILELRDTEMEIAHV